ncbi:NPCBM/NEW2 domain-containing protein [Streptomyces sp. NPDC054933]
MRLLATGTAHRRALGALGAALLCAGVLTTPATAAALPHEATANSPSTRARTTAPLLDNGLARTPPMGFNNWNSTHCGPGFNEATVEGIADIFVSKGLKAAGYQYVNLDDCWALPDRDAKGKLVPDPARFPHGIKAVADYVHAKGLKLGIYTSAGTKTCNSKGFPGALGHEYSDAQQFADWGVDYLKYDNCNNQGVDAKQRYTTMRDALKATGRRIVFSICEWGENQPWLWAADVGNLWRTTGDISDNWSSMLSNLKQNLPLAQYAGPGHWNDPDMLEVGNGGMTDTEYRSHFSMWAVMAAPLLIGNDLRKATPSTYDIITNKDVIAVDQDPLGKQGTVLSSDSGRWTVVKPMADGSRAVALFNETDQPQRIATTAAAIGLPQRSAYTLRDLWQHKDYETAGTVSATVPAHGTALSRVSADAHAILHAPAVEIGQNAAYVPAGTPATVTATVSDLGRTPATRISVALTAPSGWQVTATSPTSQTVLPNNHKLTVTWRVRPPAGTAVGTYDLGLTASYRSVLGQRASAQATGQAWVVTLPPTGTSYTSDLNWLAASNGWGPVEKDTSNGEANAGDGRPITIGGTVYPKGLGTNAPSEITYYTGGRCTAFRAQVGVDGEVAGRGSVTFEVWADGKRAATTGLLTGGHPAQPLTAAISGAQTIRLVVTDGGDGPDYDHADWADATITC